MLVSSTERSETIAAMLGHHEGRADRKSVLPNQRSGIIRGPLSALAMAIGYLGLVAILSMAPLWLQTMAPESNQPLVCTDFGGSR